MARSFAVGERRDASGPAVDPFGNGSPHFAPPSGGKTVSALGSGRQFQLVARTIGNSREFPIAGRALRWRHYSPAMSSVCSPQ